MTPALLLLADGRFDPGILISDHIPLERVVDTTGAGDLYAAGFLWGFTQGRHPAECGRIGSIAAAEICGHYGARPERNLADLVAETLGRSNGF